MMEEKILVIYSEIRVKWYFKIIQRWRKEVLEILNIIVIKIVNCKKSQSQVSGKRKRGQDDVQQEEIDKKNSRKTEVI